MRVSSYMTLKFSLTQQTKKPHTYIWNIITCKLLTVLLKKTTSKQTKNAKQTPHALKTPRIQIWGIKCTALTHAFNITYFRRPSYGNWLMQTSARFQKCYLILSFTHLIHPLSMLVIYWKQISLAGIGFSPFYA